MSITLTDDDVERFFYHKNYKSRFFVILHNGLYDITMFRHPGGDF